MVFSISCYTGLTSGNSGVRVYDIGFHRARCVRVKLFR